MIINFEKEVGAAMAERFSEQDNKLWEGHRMILPEMREKAVHTCGECRFSVEIEGQTESRWGCVVSIPRYGSLERRVPPKISVREVLRLVGRAGLEKVLAQGYPGDQACGRFLPRLSPNQVYQR
jgi:hypothetical protein